MWDTHTRQTPLSILVSVRVCCHDRPEAPPPPSVMWFYLKLLGKAEVTHSVSNKIRRHAWAKLECDFRIALGLYLVVRSDLGPSSPVLSPVAVAAAQLLIDLRASRFPLRSRFAVLFSGSSPDFTCSGNAFFQSRLHRPDKCADRAGAVAGAPIPDGAR